MTKVLEIHAGTESLSGAGDDEDLRGRFIDLGKPAQEIFDQFEADGVALVRPVESQGGHTGVVMNLDRGIIHSFYKSRFLAALASQARLRAARNDKKGTLFGTAKAVPSR